MEEGLEDISEIQESKNQHTLDECNYDIYAGSLEN